MGSEIWLAFISDAAALVVGENEIERVSTTLEINIRNLTGVF